MLSNRKYQRKNKFAQMIAIKKANEEQRSLHDQQISQESHDVFEEKSESESASDKEESEYVPESEYAKSDSNQEDESSLEKGETKEAIESAAKQCENEADALIDNLALLSFEEKLAALNKAFDKYKESIDTLEKSGLPIRMDLYLSCVYVLHKIAKIDRANIVSRCINLDAFVKAQELEKKINLIANEEEMHKALDKLNISMKFSAKVKSQSVQGSTAQMKSKFDQAYEALLNRKRNINPQSTSTEKTTIKKSRRDTQPQTNQQIPSLASQVFSSYQPTSSKQCSIFTNYLWHVGDNQQTRSRHFFALQSVPQLTPGRKW